jgi:hypothetical protein
MFSVALARDAGLDGSMRSMAQLAIRTRESASRHPDQFITRRIARAEASIETRVANMTVGGAVPSAAMTLRDHIRRRVWACAAIGFGAWLLCGVTGVLVRSPEDGAGLLPIVGFAIFGGAILALQWAVRCPKCRARLAQTVGMYIAFQWGRRQRVNFCPFCGVNLDEPVPGTGAVGQSQIQKNPIFPT